MANMSYVRHEKTATDLADVWEQWYDYEPGASVHEDRGRKRIVKLVAEMHAEFCDDGTYDEFGIEV